MIAWLLALPALAGAERVHVRDLDRDTVPKTLELHRGMTRLVVDGRLVRGSRHAQLDWLGAIFADASGHPPAALRLEERHRALHRRALGAAMVVGAPVAACVTTVLFPPAAAAWLPVSIGALGVQGAGLATSVPAHRRFDADELAKQIQLLHALRTVDL